MSKYYTITLKNNLTCKEYIIEDCMDIEDSEIYYHFKDLEIDLPDGEYTYELKDEEGSVLVSDLAQVGTIKHNNNTEYTNGKQYKQYGE